MQQLLGLAGAFVVIIFMVNRKYSLTAAMLCGSALMAITSGLPPAQLGRIVWESLANRTTLELMGVAAAITALTGILTRYSLLDRMVNALTNLLRNPKAALMAVPALIGCLPVMGGAIMSAPMVGSLGDRLGMTAAQKSAANLVFRHAWFFVFPFMPSMILASRMADVSVYQIIRAQLLLTPAALIAGYFCLLRRLSPRREEPVRSISWTTHLKEMLFYGSPLLVSLFLSVALGIPIALALLVGMAAAVGLVYKQGFHLSTLYKSVDLKLVAAMASIMVFRGLVQNGGAVSGLVQSFLSWGIPAELLLVALPMAVGIASASQSTTLGITLPLLLPLLPQANRASYVMLVYASSFVAYFGSPLHLCQVLSNEYFGVRLGEVYRAYWPVLLAILAAMGLTFVLAVH